jgi:hypothetical protein
MLDGLGRLFAPAVRESVSAQRHVESAIGLVACPCIRRTAAEAGASSQQYRGTTIESLLHRAAIRGLPTPLGRGRARTGHIRRADEARGQGPLRDTLKAAVEQQYSYEVE